jgi:Protein of unknown function (DUF3224)
MADRKQARGKINVQSYDPRPYDQVAGGPDLVEIQVTEEIHGDIEAQGAARFLQTQGDGSASFVGIERVTGTIEGRSGSFVLQDAGTVEGNTVTGQWFVVPGSGTDDLAGLRGEGGFTARLGEGADLTLEYWFE